jgi:hypothetical protein
MIMALLRILVIFAVFLFLGSCASSSLFTTHGVEEPFLPSIEAATEHGPQIFNTVHDAMRQFGSSIHHNGMSFFQVTIPMGALFYHGSNSMDVPEQLEWLAFEIEHAEHFARKQTKRQDNLSVDAEQKPFQIGQQNSDSEASQFRTSRDRGRCWDTFNPDDCEFTAGYLHMYQATRPLNLLYLDGMAAAKSSMGTNDAEDFVIVANRTRSFKADTERAIDLCAWAETWRIDGFIRMEPGFEVVYCNFRDSALRQTSIKKRPEISVPDLMYDRFEWIRAASQRYHGFGAGRMALDYSSMVSAFFFPLNLTNPNATRPELPRLLSATDAQLAAIKAHVESKTPVGRRQNPSKQGATDWQGVTDMIVTRYADVLQLAAEYATIEEMKRFLNHLLNAHIDFGQNEVDLEQAEWNCARHYLLGVITRTFEEKLIYAGILATTQLICGTLFQALKVVQSSDQDENTTALTETLSLVRGLMGTLHWSKWKECRPCASHEVCYIAMWPYGDTEDHFIPSCQNASSIFERDSYWMWEWEGD